MCRPAKNAIFYALSCVGQGADGQAWLVRDYCGLLFVCKLPKVKARNCIRAELACWEKVHPELTETELVQLRLFGPGNLTALIMPRFAHVQDGQHRDLAIREAVTGGTKFC